MIHSVTAGLDGTHTSVAAAVWAADEARARGVPLRLVEVRESGPATRRALLDAQPGGGEARQAADATMREIEEHCPGVNLAWETHTGRPASVLTALSAESALLVLGFRGGGSLRGLATKDAALSTLAHAQCPVVLVRAGADTEDPAGSSADVLADASGGTAAGISARATAPGTGGAAGAEARGAAGTDMGGTAARDAGGAPEGEAGRGRPVVLGMTSYRPCDDLLAFAFETADRTSSPLRAVHAWELPAGYGLDPVPDGSDVIGEVTQERDLALAAALRPWREKFPDVSVEPLALMGRPADLLAEAAQDASLVVVGRRRRTARCGAHIGPTAHAVLRHARTPVAVVPHD